MISRLVAGLTLGVCAIAVQPAAAQSTLFNIPSTDVVSPGKIYFEFDYFTQLPRASSGAWSTAVPRVVIGVTPQIEVGANVAFAMADGADTTTIFQPNLKYKFYANDDSGLAASAGVIGYMTNNNGDGFGQIYANVSKKMMSGSRFTVGLYGAISCDACVGTENKVGAIVGYEQPITSKVSFVADLLTGENFWGYLTPGISIVLPHSGLLNIGYSIGYNELKGNGDPDYRNNALFVYYGLVLN